ncbi:CHAT domain protein [Gemmatirosa kalamazoonensis]|uniref:CHAT domain protein n=1 Tax=Gemmatirosa kalamazoonensis TaxID=861299 RepID=W0RJZ8_9BACT|nr:CHAT domain-containing protein [Gemmatirosa kalamazoonensis]AHG89718.1 CHAT domain protein [Gemmatirosa kalamazoonensis]
MLALLVCLLLAPSAAPAGEPPRAVVRAATRAVEGDSATRLGAQWSARVARDSGDRAAVLGVATLARLRYDYPTSERLYRRLDAGPADGYALYARLGLGEGLEERRFTPAAVAEFTRARALARTLRDDGAAAHALVWLASSRGKTEGLDVLGALLDTTARLVPDSAFDVRALLDIRRGLLYALRGRPREAQATVDSGIALARRAHALRIEGDGYLSLAKVLLLHNAPFDSGLVAAHRSAALYEQAHANGALANSLIWHSYALESLGRYAEMREVARRALAEGEATHAPSAVADAHRLMGLLAINFGDWAAAAQHLDRAAALSLATGDTVNLLLTRKFQGFAALAGGDTARARRLATERLVWSRRAQDFNGIFESQRVLAAVAQRERDWTAAASALAAARAQLPRLPGADYRDEITDDEARLAVARGDLATAERALQQYIRNLAVAPGDPTETDFVGFDVRIRLADVHARRNDVARAEAEMAAALDDVEHLRARLSDTELRTLAFQRAHVFSAAAEPHGLEDAWARALGAIVGGGRAIAAFDLAERWRARELMDRLDRADALRAAAPAVARADTARHVAARSLRAVDVAAALPDDRTALLAYVGGAGAPLTVFVVRRDGVRARVLPPVDSLADRVTRFGRLLESGVDAARLGRTLGAALLDPAMPLLDARVTRLVVVPDGPLHRLPFDALRLADGHLAVERWAFGVAPSASVVATLWQRSGREARATRVVRAAAPAAPAAAPLLALGNPTVRLSRASAGGAAEETYRDAFDASGGLPPLRGAEREVALVARYSPSADVRVGDAASALFLKRADLRRYRVLHFATHAVVDERSAARTALALAPGGGESGFVGPGDLAALRLDADLVVLSACRSAGGVVVGGEGIQGLTAPFLEAGARSLVATEWRIRDQGAVPFVDAFYAALARGLPVADALRVAKLDAVRRGEPPRTWAAFVAVGDPLVTVPLKTPAGGVWAGLVQRVMNAFATPGRGGAPR